MSAESKSKRGESGKKNAQAVAFRGNGRAPDWQVRRMNAHLLAAAPSGGSTTVRGLVGGLLAMRVLHIPFDVNNPKYERMFVHAQTRVTIRLFKD